MFHLFAQFDPLTGAQVQAALVAKADELFRNEDPKDRPTSPQRFADAVQQLICSSDGTGAPRGTELIVLADYDQTHDEIANAHLTDGTHLTEAEALAIACDAKILPGIFNKHTGNVVLGRSQRKVPKWLRKQLIARDGGCIGCGAHHQICEVHHLKHWKHGGETTLENTCLLCWRCHHVRVHQNGEEITRHPGGKLTLAPPEDTPPPGTAGPTGGGRTDGHEPRSRGPGHRHAHHRHRTHPSATTAPNPTRHPVPATP